MPLAMTAHILYKDIDDNQLNKVLDYIEFLKNNPQ